MTDIDGKNTESLHLMDTSNYATTVIDPTYLEGDGTALNPWSVLASGGSAPNNRNGSKGNIDIQGIVPASSVGMVYFLNTDVSRGSGSNANRMFIADLSFSATCVD
ncbi:hypothetical protein [Ornithinimicrobium sp. INDO-MA30-4]|uniref:hypothetical protein n=1 Tax=Ornithinimicrobium sp. INDO-MA30-4 TaxID=2908651 RepID=UPI001F28158C|nr:hypothetical protein [Ornithinimicrobium sp. INDO-MA30-4]UJH70315.1 hypothetical protein L0A91_14415 [Ornithinimicrobium sp. INDO-MA30-4]